MRKSFPNDRSIPDITPRRSRPHTRRKSAVIGLMLLIMMFTILMGIGLAQAFEPQKWQSLQRFDPASAATAANPPANLIAAETGTADIGTIEGTIDPVPANLQLGQELYLENCASCHIAIPPAVMPTQTWQVLIQDPQHYGVVIDPLRDPNRRIVWNYLKAYSRPTSDDEKTPYRMQDSRYFKALHPRVNLPKKVNLGSCVTCHPGVNQFNFRQLTPEAEKNAG
ncbi:diheme cytochrome c [Alkalinema sp. FACHB-956]|uniref:diheme cytochrome c n=1 Tax=Alkalinema sp. FACHB-956 TaxID=2692768 RepID=UPI001F54E8AC|nr:diheme cytochrome c [Alkalinema sp. FACHB-956]